MNNLGSRHSPLYDGHSERAEGALGRDAGGDGEEPRLDAGRQRKCPNQESR